MSTNPGHLEKFDDDLGKGSKFSVRLEETGHELPILLYWVHGWALGRLPLRVYATKHAAQRESKDMKSTLRNLTRDDS